MLTAASIRLLHVYAVMAMLLCQPSAESHPEIYCATTSVPVDILAMGRVLGLAYAQELLTPKSEG